MTHRNAARGLIAEVRPEGDKQQACGRQVDRVGQTSSNKGD
jgi:hypothetical protein